MTPVATPLPAGFRPYAWARSSVEVAARRGLRPEQILRFDQNTPPLPGVPRIPLAPSFARLNEYPDGTYAELREAAASYCGVDSSQIVVGAGADELTPFARGRTSAPEAGPPSRRRRTGFTGSSPSSRGPTSSSRRTARP